VANTHRFTWRIVADDLAHIAIIADAMRTAGHPFATRTGAIQLALRTLAQAVRAHGVAALNAEGAKS
jgi:hypothetical protein